MQYEIRAMSFSEILDTALRLVTNHFILLVGLMAIATVPAVVAGAYLTPEGLRLGDTSGVEVLLLLLVYPIAFAATMYAIGRVYQGHEVGFGEPLEYATSNLFALMGTWLLVTLITAIGFLLLIIPGIYLSIALIAVLPIMVVEHLYGMNAINRSRELLKGNLLRAFGVLVVASVIASVLSGAAQLALNPIPVVGVIGAALVQSVTAAFTSAAQLVLYFEIRCRKEGFDIEHLAQRAEAGASADVTGI